MWCWDGFLSQYLGSISVSLHQCSALVHPSPTLFYFGNWRRLWIKYRPSFWETNSCAACKEIARILWNPKVRYRAYKSFKLIPILGHMNHFNTFPSCFCKIHYNIIHSCSPRSSIAASFRFPHRNCMHVFSLRCVLHARIVPSLILSPQ